MKLSQIASVAMLLIVLMSPAVSEQSSYDGQRFRLYVPHGFILHPSFELEGEGAATHVFTRFVENKLASIIQISIMPPNPGLKLETDEEIRRACIVGMEQAFASLKKSRSNFSSSDPEDIEIGGVRGVKATWEAIYEPSFFPSKPGLPEKGIFYVIADEYGFLLMRVGGDESSYASITLGAAQAIETMRVQKPLDDHQ